MKSDKRFKNNALTNKIFHNKFQIILTVAFCICVYLCSSVDEIAGQGLPVAVPNTVGMSEEKLNQIDALVEKDISEKKLPGAVVDHRTQRQNRVSARLTAIAL